MTDETPNIVLRHLRAIHGEPDDIAVDFAEFNRVDHIDTRLERIETRLDLLDV